MGTVQPPCEVASIEHCDLKRFEAAAASAALTTRRKQADQAEPTTNFLLTIVTCIDISMYASRILPHGGINVTSKRLRHLLHTNTTMNLNPQAETWRQEGRARGLHTSIARSRNLPRSHYKGHTVPTDDLEATVNSLQNISIGESPSALPADTHLPRPEPAPKPWRATQANKMNTVLRVTPGMKEIKDKKVPPSAASGGTPDPTRGYLAASNTPVKPLATPQHLLVVIDLNGTLLFRPHSRFPTNFVARPNTYKFLKYCINTFNVVIWSSARPENVQAMCDAILDNDLRKQLVATWGRERLGLTQEDYRMRVQCYKRLTKLWLDPRVAQSHPNYKFGARWDQTNTVLIDDSPEKGRSEPFNLITIPEFFGDQKEYGEILPQVHDYINNLSMHSNVSAYLRAYPFQALPAARDTARPV